MKILAAIFWTGILIGACAGCATPLTDYERADREILRLEAFVVYERSCNAQGGMVEITRRGGWLPRRCMSQACPPARHDAVSCVAR